jgi:hypothetical protein
MQPDREAVELRGLVEALQDLQRERIAGRSGSHRDEDDAAVTASAEGEPLEAPGRRRKAAADVDGDGLAGEDRVGREPLAEEHRLAGRGRGLDAEIPGTGLRARDADLAGVEVDRADAAVAREEVELRVEVAVALDGAHADSRDAGEEPGRTLLRVQRELLEVRREDEVAVADDLDERELRRGARWSELGDRDERDAVVGEAPVVRGIDLQAVHGDALRRLLRARLGDLDVGRGEDARDEAAVRRADFAQRFLRRKERGGEEEHRALCGGGTAGTSRNRARVHVVDSSPRSAPERLPP